MFDNYNSVLQGMILQTGEKNILPPSDMMFYESLTAAEALFVLI